MYTLRCYIHLVFHQMLISIPGMKRSWKVQVSGCCVGDFNRNFSMLVSLLITLRYIYSLFFFQQIGLEANNTLMECAS